MTETKTLTLLSRDRWLDVADYRLSTHAIENIRHVNRPEDLKCLEISGRYGTVNSEIIVVNLDKSFRALVLGFEHDAQFALSNCVVQWTQLDENLAQLTITHELY